jgi:hypothetical protein
MKNSVETILGDMKKLFKELEIAYGDVKPQLCDANNAADSCTNKNCWVNRSRNDYFDRICDLERAINNAIEEIDTSKLTPENTLLLVRTKLSKSVTPKELNDNETLPKVAIQF